MAVKRDTMRPIVPLESDLARPLYQVAGRQGAGSPPHRRGCIWSTAR